MKIILIRHGKTKGNLEKRYIGRTDESLCDAGRKELAEKSVPPCDVLVSSPMKRCLETASILYPCKSPVICGDFRECDFGDFECRNYIELSGDRYYQSWIDSGGVLPFPNGESTESFKRRCRDAFIRITEEYKAAERLGFVVHGGTIMSVMEAFAVPEKNYFDYQISCGCGYIADFCNGKIYNPEKI